MRRSTRAKSPRYCAARSGWPVWDFSDGRTPCWRERGNSFRSSSLSCTFGSGRVCRFCSCAKVCESNPKCRTQQQVYNRSLIGLSDGVVNETPRHAMYSVRSITYTCVRAPFWQGVSRNQDLPKTMTSERNVFTGVCAKHKSLKPLALNQCPESGARSLELRH